MELMTDPDADAVGQPEERVRALLMQSTPDFVSIAELVAEKRVDRFSADDAEGLATLRQLSRDPGSRICNTVWKADELAYKCATCGEDPTCAICMQCFKESDHSGHNYVIVRSGGGCCDCGDSQAWKPSGFCKRHGRTSTEDVDPSTDLADDVRKRLALTIRIALDEVLKHLLDPRRRERSSTHGVNIVKWLTELAECGDSFRSVISTELAQEHITVSPTETRCFLWCFIALAVDRSDCNELLESLYALFYQLLGVLEFKRCFLLQLKELYKPYIMKLAKQETRRRAALASRDHTDLNHSVIDFANRILNGVDLLRDVDFGALVEEAQAPNVDEFMDASVPAFLVGGSSEDEAGDDVDSSKSAQLLNNFSVQIFAVPALVSHVIEQDGMLDVQLNTMYELLRGVTTLTRENATYTTHTLRGAAFQCRRDVTHRAMLDARYILRHPGTLRHLFYRRPDLLRTLVWIAGTVQGTEPIRRLTGSDVPMMREDADVEMRNALLILEKVVFMLFEFLVHAMELDAFEDQDAVEIRIAFVHMLVNAMREWVMGERLLNRGRSRNVGESPVHLHLILHRLVALFTSHMVEHGTDVGELVSATDAHMLIMEPLRLLAAFAQIRARMWRRNNRLTTVMLPDNYRDINFETGFDTYLLQLGAVMAGAVMLERELLAKFGLRDVLFGDEGGSSQSQTEAQALPVLMEQCLSVLIQVTVERTRSGFSPRQLLRHHFIHCLALSNMRYSQLLRAIPQRLRAATHDGFDVFDKEIVMDVLQEVANFTPASGTVQGLYSVKDELLGEVNRFAVYLSAYQQQALENRYRHARPTVQGIPCIMEARVTDLPLQPCMRPLLLVPTSVCRPNGLVMKIFEYIRGLAGDAASATAVYTHYYNVLIAATYLCVLASECCEPGDDFWRAILSGDNSLPEHLIWLRSNEVLRSDFRPMVDRTLGNFRVKGAVSETWLRSHAPELFDGDDHGDDERRRKERRAALRAKQRAVMMDLQSKQNNFVGMNDDLDDDTFQGSDDDAERDEIVDRTLYSAATNDAICAICRESSDHVNGKDAVLGAIGLALSTRVLQLARDARLGGGRETTVAVRASNCESSKAQNEMQLDEDQHDLQQASEGDIGDNVDRGQSPANRNVQNTFGGNLLRDGVDGRSRCLQLNLCGHHIHNRCFEKHFEGLLDRHNEALGDFEDMYVNIMNGEFLCPVCRRLSNVFLPLYAPASTSTSAGESSAREPAATGDRGGGTDQSLRTSPPRSTALSDDEWFSRSRAHFLGAERSSRVKTLSSWQQDGENSAGAARRLERLHDPERELTIPSQVYRLAPSLFSVDEYAVRRAELLLFALATSVATTELVLRSGYEPYPSAEMASKTLTLTICSARGQLASILDTDEMRALWAHFDELQRGGKAEAPCGVDPFLLLLYVLMLWPGRLKRSDAERVLRVCHRAFRDVGSDRSAELLFLRRSKVLLDGLLGQAAKLESYGSVESQRGALSELQRLRNALGICKRDDADNSDEQETAELVTLRLTPLPPHFQEIFEKVKRGRCRECLRNAWTPAMCLVCGEVLYGRRLCCNTWRPVECLHCHKRLDGGDAPGKCCSVQSRELLEVCSNHAEAEGAGIGIFIMLDSCLQLSTAFVLREGRHSFCFSPYLDSHGEEDPGLLRGKQLQLSQDRIGALERQWLTSSFDYNPKFLDASRPIIITDRHGHLTGRALVAAGITEP